MKSGLRLAAALSLSLLPLASTADPVVTDSSVISNERRVAILEWKLASLRQQVALLEDSKAIERLQQAYGYYISEGMYDEAAALFSDDPGASIELAQQGVYIGKSRIRAFLTHGGGLKDGEIQEGAIWQGVLNVSPDGKSARGRWRTLVMGGTYGQDGTWTEGPYENQYIKENGVWKLHKVHWYMTVKASYDQGWHKKHMPAAGPIADLPPDRPPTDQYESWPAFFLPPYHYEHPVTGKPVAWD